MEGAFGIILSFVLQFLPLFLIPFAFRLAGGAIGQIGGFLMGQGKKGASFMQGDDRDPHSLRSRAKRNASADLTRYQQQKATEGRAVGANWRARAKGRVAARFPGLGPVDVRTSRHMAEAAKMRQEQSDTGDDSLIFAGAGYEKNGKFYNSKNEEISKAEYKDGKRLYGRTNEAVAQGLQYQLGKALTDTDRAKVRTAFAENAMANNWTQEEISGQWAAITFPLKGDRPAEWYSQPDLITENADGTGKRLGVSFRDVGSNDATYGKMIDEKHKNPQAFEAGKIKDVEWRAMADHQSRVGQKILNGTHTAKELENYAKTSEILDNAVSKGFIQQDDDGNVTASGASAAASKVIQAAYDNSSNVKVRHAREADGSKSLNRREVYEPEGQLPDPSDPSGRKTIPDPSKPERVLGETIVTGDGARSETPKYNY